MKNKEEKLIKDLKEEYNSLLEEAKCEEKIIKTIKDNKFESKLTVFAGCSVLPLILLFSLIGFLKIPVVPIPELVSLTLLGGSLGVGAVFTKMIGKKFKLKERLNKITSSQTQQELLEEEMIHQIKYELAKNKMDIIDQAINNINSKNEMINSISPNYIVSYNTNLNIDEINSNINNLKTKLSESFKELAILTKKCVLSNNFYNDRDRIQSIVNTLVISLMFGSFLMLLWNFPIFSIAGSVNMLNLFLPIPLAGAVGAGYIIKRTKDSNKVFDKLNAELNEDALPKKPDIEETSITEKQLAQKMKDISVLYTELVEQQELLKVKEEENQDSKESKKVVYNNINPEVELSYEYDDPSEKEQGHQNKQLVKKKKI